MFLRSKISLGGYNHNIDTKYMEHIMDLLELGAVAQIVGALAIFTSVALVIIELRKNLKQNHFANSLQRAIEWEKINYKQMEENMAKVIAKASASCDNLEHFERIQFDAFVQQRIQVALRGFRVDEESAFIIGADELRERVQTAMEEFFSSQGVHQCYDSSIKRNLIHDDTLLKKIVSGL